ncbi:MAG: hypothetical protein ACRDP6_32260 [Actinoallomurus sp.]
MMETRTQRENLTIVTLWGGDTYFLVSMRTDEVPEWIADAMPHPLGHIVGTADIAGWAVHDSNGVHVGYAFQRGLRFHAEFVSLNDGDLYVARPHRNRLDASVAAIARGRADEIYWLNKRAKAAAIRYEAERQLKEANDSLNWALAYYRGTPLTDPKQFERAQSVDRARTRRDDAAAELAAITG